MRKGLPLEQIGNDLVNVTGNYSYCFCIYFLIFNSSFLISLPFRGLGGK
jgi:hypothetical protein